MNRTRFLLILFALLVAAWLVFEWASRIAFPPVSSPEEREERRRASARTRPSDAERATAAAAKKWRETLTASGDLLSEDPATAAAQRNAAANELLSLPELPEGVVADLARMFWSPGEDVVWRDYCLQFLGSALERPDGVTDADRDLARETLAMALSSTNATFAGTALRALHRGDPSDPLVAASALRIARDSTYPSASRITALLILEDCVRAAGPVAGPQVAGPKSILPDNKPSTFSTSSTPSTLAETAAAVSADPSASSLLRQTAEAVLRRVDPSRGLE